MIEASSKVHEVVVLGSSEFNKLHSPLTENEAILNHNELDAILGTDVQIEILKIVKEKISEKVLQDLEQKIQENEKQSFIRVEFSEKEKESFKNAKEEFLEHLPVATIAALVGLGGPIGLSVAAVGGLGLLLSKRNKKAP